MVAVASQLPTADPKGTDFFEKKVRPIFVQNCYSCHSHAANKIRGGLALDSRNGWEKGGETGPAVVPGNPDKSLLIQAIRRTRDNLKMPPRQKLSDADIAILSEWVRQGAPDPRVLTKAPDAAQALSRSGWIQKSSSLIRRPLPNQKRRKAERACTRTDEACSA